VLLIVPVGAVNAGAIRLYTRLGFQFAYPY